MEYRPDDVDSEVFYQEFQLNAGLFGGKVDYVTGLNYFSEDSGAATVTVNRRSTSTYTGTGGLPGTPPNADAGLFRSADTDTGQKSDSYGWFNSLTWHATDKFNVTVGARLAYDKKAIEQTRFPTNGDNWTPAPGTTSTTVNADDAWTEVDWRGTLDYHFTKDIMVYTTASKAYRAGQYSLTVLANVPGELQSDDFIEPIPPEEVINYELGARATFFDGRLRLNPTGLLHEVEQPSGRASGELRSGGPGHLSHRLPHQRRRFGRCRYLRRGARRLVRRDGEPVVRCRRGHHAGRCEGSRRQQRPEPVPGTGFTELQRRCARTVSGSATRAASGSIVNYAYVGKQETHPTSGSDSSYELPKYSLVGCAYSVAEPERERQHQPVRGQPAGRDLRDLRHALRRRVLGFGQRHAQPRCTAAFSTQCGERPTAIVRHHLSAQLLKQALTCRPSMGRHEGKGTLIPRLSPARLWACALDSPKE